MATGNGIVTTAGTGPVAKPPEQVKALRRRVYLAAEYADDPHAAGGGQLRALPPYVDARTRQWGPGIYDDLLNDETVYSGYQTLADAVFADGLNLRPAVDDKDDELYESAKEVLADVERVLDDMETPLDQVGRSMLVSSLCSGNKVAEKVYRKEDGAGDDPNGGRWALDRLKPKSRRSVSYVVDRFNNLQGYLTLNTGLGTGYFAGPLDPARLPEGYLPAEKFLALTYDPQDGSPLGRPVSSCIYDAWHQKLQVLREWLIHLGRFGSPSILATTAPESDASPVADEAGNVTSATATKPEQEMLNALLRWRNGGVAVIPYGANAQFLQTVNAGDSFLKRIDYADRQITKGILRSVRMTMESRFGSRADSQTSQDVTGLFTRFLKSWLGTVLTRGLVRPLVAYNRGEEAARQLAPYLSLSPVEHQDWGAELVAATTAYKGGVIREDQLPSVWERMGIPASTLPAPPPPQPPPQPGAPPGPGNGPGTAPGGKPPPQPPAPPQGAGAGARAAVRQKAAAFAWEESLHPRAPGGTPEGGEFAPGGAASGGGSKAERAGARVVRKRAEKARERQRSGAARHLLSLLTDRVFEIWQAHGGARPALSPEDRASLREAVRAVGLEGIRGPTLATKLDNFERLRAVAAAILARPGPPGDARDALEVIRAQAESAAKLIRRALDARTSPPASFSWDESQHPRDEIGRFAAAAGAEARRHYEAALARPRDERRPYLKENLAAVYKSLKRDVRGYVEKRFPLALDRLAEATGLPRETFEPLHAGLSKLAGEIAGEYRDEVRELGRSAHQGEEPDRALRGQWGLPGFTGADVVGPFAEAAENVVEDFRDSEAERLGVPPETDPGYDAAMAPVEERAAQLKSAIAAVLAATFAPLRPGEKYQSVSFARDEAAPPPPPQAAGARAPARQKTAAFSWDDAKHPRDEIGRFASAAGAEARRHYEQSLEKPKGERRAFLKERLATVYKALKRSIAGYAGKRFGLALDRLAEQTGLPRATFEPLRAGLPGLADLLASRYKENLNDLRSGKRSGYFGSKDPGDVAAHFRGKFGPPEAHRGDLIDSFGSAAEKVVEDFRDAEADRMGVPDADKDYEGYEKGMGPVEARAAQLEQAIADVLAYTFDPHRPGEKYELVSFVREDTPPPAG